MDLKKTKPKQVKSTAKKFLALDELFSAIGTHAGGGGQSSCPGGHGGNGGSAGKWPPKQAPHCYDKSASGGNAGSSSSGGGGGDSCGNHYGGGGGGGGLQFGHTNFKTHLSYGGGGGGGGASAFRDDPNPGGKGGSGGGLVYLQVGKLVLQGTISVKGNSGQCLNRKRHRSAPGGSGAGGSVVIFTKKLIGDPKSKISVSGGDAVKCAFGTGGGKQTKSFANHAVEVVVSDAGLYRKVNPPITAKSVMDFKRTKPKQVNS
ncbi:loricrin-like [Pocillopora damicornis]|uniref:loricrin-like n=1 Tax=Pocillopora damicornis TaxID=46731 RepID=UPI000F558B29|nr:loricrin-like [Pocillopora damicornis]